MEGSNEYDSQIMQNEEPIICINEIKIDQVMEERKNQSLQTKISRISRVCEKTNEEKQNTFWNNCKFNLKMALS
jgi:hypothetical protein